MSVSKTEVTAHNYMLCEQEEINIVKQKEWKSLGSKALREKVSY